MPHTTQIQGFRKDINGLRAWAVTVVILYHFEVPGFRGGFVGVDLFFAISGFLMTRIVIQGLYRSKTATGFSVSRFYLARARRIIPALAALCASLLILGWFFLIPIEYEKLGGHIVSALGFFSNYKFRSRAGYFNAASQENWLLHTWSLSVEWQFYLVFPLLLMMAWKLRPGIVSLKYTLATGFILSLALSIVLSPLRPSDAFYLLPTRAWEMLAGGLAYLTTYRHGFSKPSSRRLEALGLALIIVATLALDENRSWPGIWAVAPVSGAVAILLANRAESAWTGNALSQWLGTHSYSLYLWHWPIAVTLNHLDLRNSAVAVLCGLILTGLLGKLSFRLIENPARKYLAQEKPFMQSMALILGVLFIAANAQYIKETHGVNSRLPASLRDISSFKFDYAFYREGRCLLRPEQTATALASCIDSGHAESSEIVLLWGDSYAAHLYPGLSKTATDKWRLAQMTSIGCPPILGLEMPNKPHCKATNDIILEWIRNEMPNRVILAGNWVIYDWQQVSRTVDTLKSMGVKRIDLVGPAPMWKKNLSSILIETAWNDEAHGHVMPHRLSQGLKPRLSQTDREMKDYAHHAGINFISVYDILCEAGGCLAFVDEPHIDNLIAWDNGHFTVPGSNYVVSKFPR
ncbi:MAG: acyltransferase family protein [Candidatus Macondimonas sp.]